MREASTADVCPAPGEPSLDAATFARSFSDHTHFKPNRFHPLVWINGEPEIGEGVYIGGMSEVNARHARVRIGDFCDIASFVSINCADSHRLSLGLSDQIDRRDITLEHHVFVGSHSVIKGGAHIGHHSVVAAGTIVEGRTIPPYSLVVGNPMVVKPGYYQPAESGTASDTPAPVPHNRPTLGAEEEAAALAVLRSGWLAQGAQVRALEDEICALLGLPSGHAVALSSGSAALFVALRLLGAAGRTVATPAYACAALANACHLAGGRPQFLDNAKGSPNIDLAAVGRSAAPLAIVPHMFGLPQDLSALTGCRVIEDAAQALGASVRGVPVGLQGEVGIFSMYATKLITSGGQGGLLVSRDKALVEAARDFRAFDQRPDRLPRMNLQMTDLQAAVGRAQLKKLPGFLARRAELFDCYRAAGLPLLDVADPALSPVRFRAVVQTAEPQAVIAALEAEGVRAIVPQDTWELQGDAADAPHAAALSANTVSLPLYPSLSDADAQRIARTVAMVLAGR
jgi:perosamine synthetase